jgi:hypothetical protein
LAPCEQKLPVARQTCIRRVSETIRETRVLLRTKLSLTESQNCGILDWERNENDIEVIEANETCEGGPGGDIIV